MYLVFLPQETPMNIFDNIPALAKPKLSELHVKLMAFLSPDPEHVDDVLTWWFERRSLYPRLYWMALNYLTLPGEQIVQFSL